MNTTRKLVLGLAVASAAACSHQSDPETTPDTTTSTEVVGPVATDEPRRASTNLETTSATELQGTATFEETADGVSIVLNVEHAKPGKQAVHVHELGDCSDIAGKSMGEHFAPDYKEHALPQQQEERHLGDLGNIVIDKEGKGTLEIVAPRASLKPNDSHSFLGKALVVHEKLDKGTQPAGDSGTPVACGVIKNGTLL